jgi:hypothetical protein
MKKLTSLFLAMLLFRFNVGYSANCKDDTLWKVSRDGEILIMLSGEVYEVLPGDEIDSQLWLPSSEVTICEKSLKIKGKLWKYYEIINLDEGEKVGALRIK